MSAKPTMRETVTVSLGPHLAAFVRWLETASLLAETQPPAPGYDSDDGPSYVCLFRAGGRPAEGGDGWHVVPDDADVPRGINYLTEGYLLVWRDELGIAGGTDHGIGRKENGNG